MSLKQSANTLENILKDVLSEIKPKKEERKRIKQIAEKIQENVKETLKDISNLQVEFHGSYVKDTWLSGETDLDLFLVFKEKRSRKRIKEILQKVEGETSYDFHRRYAEHPYLRANIQGIGVDFVPAFQIGEKLTAVDRTPKHTEWVQKHLCNRKKDEVRLLKKFLKGIGAYGAEIKVGGFSGMACEVMIEETGSFYSLLSYFRKQKDIFLDPTNTWKRQDAFDFFDSPFVVIDPTDRERDLLAAVTKKKFVLTKIASNYLLKDPKREFFFPRQPEVNKQEIKNTLKERAIILLQLPIQKNVPPDTFWGQAKRVKRKISSHFQRSVFRFYSSDVWKANLDIYIGIELARLKKPRYSLVVGPPPHIPIENINDFMKEYSENIGPWVGYSGRIIAEEKLSEKERRAKTHIIHKLKELKLAPSFSLEEAQVLDNPTSIISTIEEAGCLTRLVKFLERRLPWLY